MSTVRPLNGFVMVATSDLHPSPANPRDRLPGIEDLAQSIREVGLIQPIVAQKVPGRPGLRIVAGHRRHAAAKLLGLAEVPVIVRRDMLPDEELLAMLVENGQRSDLDPIEEAHALRTLSHGGLTPGQVAAKIGRSLGYVSSRLSLLSLPPEDQEAVRAGHYTLGHARNIVQAQRAAARKALQPTARPVGRPKGAKTKPYFGDHHPLAKTARARCGHRGTPKVNGGVACGECWETTIRESASQAVAS